jgi:glucokinase
MKFDEPRRHGMNRLLLADIGGTFARFAAANGAGIGTVWTTSVSYQFNVLEAIEAFLTATGGSRRFDGALIAAAGPVEGGRCQLTNSSWVVDEAEIGRAFGIPWIRLVNDLEALAAGLPGLADMHVRAIGPGASVPGAPMAVVAPGTGLGLACVTGGPAGRCVVAGEGGHATLSAIDDESDHVIEFLRHRFGHASAERALSGAGLVNLHDAIVAWEGARPEPRTPNEITKAAMEGTSQTCVRAVDMFCTLLGVVAGNAALTFGARGGVYIGGGIVPRFGNRFVDSRFREAFAAKGRMKEYLSHIPTRLILHPNPTFVGLYHIAESVRGLGKRMAIG